MAGQDGSDADRDAILARRKRFIALTLTGLSTACPKQPEPEPNTTIPTTTTSPTGEEDGESNTDGESNSSGESNSGETGPAPCLQFDLPPEDTDTDSDSDSGGVKLDMFVEDTDTDTEPKLDLPPEDTDTDGDTDTGDTGPRPCLAPLPGGLPDDP